VRLKGVEKKRARERERERKGVKEASSERKQARTPKEGTRRERAGAHRRAAPVAAADASAKSAAGEGKLPSPRLLISSPIKFEKSAAPNPPSSATAFS
jgi:hypothetical protein